MKSTKECLKWLWVVSRPSRIGIVRESAAGILRIGVSLCVVWISKHLVDIATGAADGEMWWPACLMVVLPLLQLGLGSLSAIIENRNEVVLRNSLKLRLFNHALRLRSVGRRGLHSGDTSLRISDDVATVSNLICREVPYALISMAQLAGALAYLMYIDVRLSLCLVVIMPAVIIVSRVYLRKMRPVNEQLRDADSRANEFIQEHLRHRNLVRAMERTDYAGSRLTTLLGKVYELTIIRTRTSLTSGVLIQTGFALGYALVFVWSVWGLKSGIVTFGVMTALLQLVAQVQRPTVELSRVVPRIVRAVTSAGRIAELMELTAEDSTQGTLLETPVGIKFSDVSYSYPDDTKPAVQNFSYTFRPGTMTAILGPTGAGKTTLFRMILGMISPRKGRVVMFDRNGEVAVSPGTRCNVAYVPQGNTLLSGTVRSNLLMGNPEASGNELREALIAAEARFVFDLPDEVETPCGEGGYGFSEGQAQRIAIARALLSCKSIILLDEPTSALDASTGSALLANLQQCGDSHTIIIITHNEMVAQCCQHVVKLSKL